MVGHIAYVADYTAFGVYDCRALFAGGVPVAPDSLTAEFDADAQTMNLRWSRVTQDTLGLPLQIDRYVVYRSAQPGQEPMDILGSPVPPDTNIFFDSTSYAQPQTKFYYRVKAVKD
jgi:hypothetical protein